MKPQATSTHPHNDAAFHCMETATPSASRPAVRRQPSFLTRMLSSGSDAHGPPPTRSFNNTLNRSMLMAGEWLESMSSASHFDFGDIDFDSEDNEGIMKLDYPEHSGYMVSPRDATMLTIHLNSKPMLLRGLSHPVPVAPPVASPQPRRPELSSRLQVILDDQTLFSMYKRLMYIALIINIVLLCLMCTGNWSAAEGKAPLFTTVNVFLCILFRNEAFFRIVYWLTVCALARAWVPVRVKYWVTSFLQSVGGLHSGTGMSSVIWMAKTIYDMRDNKQLASDAMVGVGYALVILLSVSCLGAFPVVRHLFHDTFEFSHRMAGWGALGFLWAFVVLAARHTQTSVPALLESSTSGSPPPPLLPLTPLRDVLESMPEYWLAIGVTILVVLPWLSVRRVRVEFENTSTHASQIRFPGPVRAGYLGRISRTLFGDWHAFGIISDNRFTHTILASAVGDFTKSLVSDRPQHLYTRTVKFAGLPYLIHMYQRVLLVATGSGLCPFLSFLIQDTYPDVYVIWVGKNLRQNFGDEIVNAVEEYPADKRIVRDTAIHARPNILELTVATAKAHRVEVIIVTSNPTGTRDIVNGCREAGLAAFGPIWDS